ncbi:MAG: hypothetical protein ACRC5M_04830 [Anaeroplasmataceae bacterium]
MGIINYTEKSVITVLGVRFSEWIPALHCYGPLNRCSIKLTDVVNLLNNDIDVILTDEQNQSLYIFIKQYNDNIDMIKSYKPKATRAEEVLFKRIYGKVKEFEKEERKDNPFVEPEDRSLDIAALNIALTATNTNGMKDPLIKHRDKKLKRTKAYELFGSVDIANSFHDRVDKANELSEFGCVDFDIE